MNRHETEDGMGFSGLAPSPQERAAERYEDARNKIAAAREATIKAQAAEIARLRAERDALRAENEKLKAACREARMVAETDGLDQWVEFFERALGDHEQKVPTETK